MSKDGNVSVRDNTFMGCHKASRTVIRTSFLKTLKTFEFTTSKSDLPKYGAKLSSRQPTHGNKTTSH